MSGGLLATSVLSAMLLLAGAPFVVFGAQNEQGASVLVKLTKLERGSLPSIVTVFGKVEASTSMRQTITAPATAVVDAIFVKAGEKVDAGAPLIRLGPTPETVAAYKKAVSALDDARELVQRTQTLLEQHLATRQQLADAEKIVSDAQASLNALSAEGASTPQTLSAADNAIVTTVSTSLGAIVNQGAVLIDLARREGLLLHAGVVPERATEIHQGDSAKVMPLGQADSAMGNVVLRGSIVDPNTGLVPVDIALPPGPFFPGQTAQAAVITATVNGYVVPHEAVLINDNGAPYVVQAKDMTAHQVPVNILLSAGASDVISGALDSTADLVLDGNHQLKDGMKIRVSEPN